jgi:Domain of unknown function (DUF4111)
MGRPSTKRPGGGMMRLLQNETVSALPKEVNDFTRSVVRRLGLLQNDRLVGAYVVGSVALGDYVPRRSDIDVVAVVLSALSAGEKQAIVETLSHPHLECPTRGLELVLYERAHVAAPRSDGAFEINVNTGPGMHAHVSFDPASDPRHWFVIDRSIAQAHGLRLCGPPPGHLFAPLPRPWLLGALAESRSWYRAHDQVGSNSVLNACRAWRYTAEATWSSKTRAAAWAKARSPKLGPILDLCLALRAGSEGQELDREAVDRLLDHTGQEVAAALAASEA